MSDDKVLDFLHELFDDETCCECCGNERAEDTGLLGEKCAKDIGDFIRVVTDAFISLTEEQREYVLDNNDMNEILKGLI